MKKPTTGTRTVTLANGCHKTVPLHSYAVLMTQIGGSEVLAVRMDDQPTGVTAAKDAQKENPGWKLKSVVQLTDRDFEEGVK